MQQIAARTQKGMFQVNYKELSKETQDAIAELREMETRPDKYPRYSSFSDLVKDVFENDQPAETRSSAFLRIRDGLLEAIALEHGYGHPEIKKRFKEALHEFNPSLKDSALDAIVKDMYDLTDFSSPGIRTKSLAEIVVVFYRSVYLHTGCYSEESITEIRYKGLIPEANALEAVAAARQALQEQKDIAYKHLDALVDAIVAFVICDEEQIRQISAELSEWCDDGDTHFLELDKKLSRHIYLNYPQMVKYDAMFKLRFVEPDGAMHQPPKLVKVEPFDQQKLQLFYETGEIRLFDVSPYIKGSWFGHLGKKEYFGSVRLLSDRSGIQWPEGQDIAPHELYENSLPLKEISSQ